MKSKTILFYSSVPTKKMFSIQQYYKTDILILKELGFRVKLSKTIFDYFLFWKYDIAFIYFFRYGFFAGFIARLLFKKVIFTGGIDNLNRQTTPTRDYQIQKVFFVLSYFVSNRVIFVSNSDIENVKSYFPIRHSSRNVLSAHVINYDIYKECNIDNKGKLVTTIAWMLKVQNITRKGIDKAVYSFAELLKIDPDFTMVIIGPIGNESEYLFNIIHSLGLDDKITVTGALPELEKVEYLKRSSIYLQLSEYEGFGIAAIEALASGNIVLHSNKGGLADGVGSYGVIVDDINEYKKIGELMCESYNSTDKANMAKRGVEHVCKNFQFNRRLNDFGIMFRDLLKV